MTVYYIRCTTSSEQLSQSYQSFHLSEHHNVEYILNLPDDERIKTRSKRSS